MTTIKSNKMKPGKTTSIGNLKSVEGDFRLEVEDSDNGIILVVFTDDDSSITIKGGDGPLAGGDKVYVMESGCYNYIYLETGPYLHYHGENKGYILMYTGDKYMSAWGIQLI